MLPEIFKDFMIKKLFDLAEWNFFLNFILFLNFT